ncbi:hypothetical protein ACVW00_001783 [Marmoricola sp. URHA0025 HA25]
MADNDEVSGTPDRDATPTEETRPVLPPDPAAAREADPAAATAGPTPVMKPRWRDRVWTFQAMLAVALATLVLGGVVGASIVALADDGNDHGRIGMGPGGPGMPGWRGPHRFRDGGPRWQWNDGPQPPDGQVTPYGQQPPAPAPSPAPASPSQ